MCQQKLLSGLGELTYIKRSPQCLVNVKCSNQSVCSNEFPCACREKTQRRAYAPVFLIFLNPLLMTPI